MPTTEQLLQDAAWLRRLATRLASDRDDADDLVQESWIAAWRRQPDADRPMRAWLTKVVRDIAAMRRRSDRRRVAREALVDEARSPAAPDELVEQMCLHRLLVDLVLELDEPYRSTIIARFVEGRTSASIAKSLGIPDGTVRKRLHEGLARLRAGLDANAGDRKRWAPAVLAFAKGGLHMAKPTKLVLAVLAAILLATAATVVVLVLPGEAKHERSDSSAQVAAPTSNPIHSRASDAALARVTVAVTDAAGPITDAVVRCAPATGEVLVARTARDGSVVVDLAAGEWSIAASADGHEPAETALAVTGDARVALALASGGRVLTGAVTDASGGAIVGARIDAARLDANTRPGRAVAVAFTDARGRYKLSVASGPLVVAASHPAYAPQTRHVEGVTASFALVPGGVIEGVVRDARTKEPVAGAIVRARHDAAALELAEASEQVAIADGDGRYRVAGLRPGAYTLSARGGALRTRTPVHVALGIAEQLPDVVVLVGAGATLRGTVVDEGGATVPAVVSVSNGFREDNTASAAGSFVVEGVMPGRWMLRAKSDRYIPEGQTLVEVMSDDVDGLVVHVRRGLAIDGHVEPRQRCEIALRAGDDGNPMTADHDTSVTTTDDGNFHFGPLSPGKETIDARCPSGDEGTLEVTAGDAERVVVVRPGGSIAGRVVDTDKTPIAGVTVTAELRGGVTTVVGGAITSGAQAITSADGTFEIRGLAAADYRVTALDRGRPMKAIGVALATAEHATVEIALQRPSGTIRGTIIGPDGAPVADAWVALVQTTDELLDSMKAAGVHPQLVQFDGDGGGDVPPALSDAHGRFELTSVPPGKYRVIVEAQAGKLRGRTDNVTADADITIPLAAVGSLRGTVHGARGPSELFSVRIVGPTTDTRPFTDGAFEFPRVDPGDYAIEVTSRDGTGTATAHVASSVASVDIALVANATVTGRLVDKDHKPIIGMSVALALDRPPEQFQVVLQDLPPSSGRDGRFRVDGQAGKMTLVVLGRPPTLKPGLALEPGSTTDVGDVIVP